MSALNLLLLLLGCLVLRTSYILVRLFSSQGMELLWYDYERRGFRFVLALALDVVTLVAFICTAFYAMTRLDSARPFFGQRSGVIFVSWLGTLLLTKLQVHRFPRTNLPGTFSEAQINFWVHVIVSFLGAAVFTTVAGIWAWLRQ
jgi:hypothetical protein